MIFLAIVLIIFGPKNLPKLAKSMGRAVRDFKGGLSGLDSDLEDEEEQAAKPAETRAQIEAKHTTVTTTTAERVEPIKQEKAD